MSEFAQYSRDLTQLCRIPVSIHKVSGADIFYTDGAVSGATFRLQMPDSSLVFLNIDGSEHWVRDSPLFVKHAAVIKQYVSSLNYRP